jgi:pimeloyl-ACP methyl ester carboxylesterase
MRKVSRLLKSVLRLLLPTCLLLVLALAGSSVWLVHESAHPLTRDYLVTPEKYGMLSARAAQVTDEMWTNQDGTRSRGWLLKGVAGAPAVLLLHKYGADRSYELNLGVKLNEATNYTVLMPDLRGHGKSPAVEWTSLGGCESTDTLAAIQYLRGLKADDQQPLVGAEIGLYGLEMGALAALRAAAGEQTVKALVLDSVPQSGDALLESIVDKRFPFASSVTAKIAEYGTTPYYYEGCYQKEPVNDTAKRINVKGVMLLAGVDAPEFQDSTLKLSKSFAPGTAVEAKTDLSPSGYGIMNASIDKSGAYDQKVIDFFRNTLGSY